MLEVLDGGFDGVARMETGGLAVLLHDDRDWNGSALATVRVPKLLFSCLSALRYSTAVETRSHDCFFFVLCIRRILLCVSCIFKSTHAGFWPTGLLVFHRWDDSVWRRYGPREPTAGTGLWTVDCEPWSIPYFLQRSVEASAREADPRSTVSCISFSMPIVYMLRLARDTGELDGCGIVEGVT